MRLALQDVHTYYQASHILQGISLTVGEGEVVALLGRNGAGKTTTMRSIIGLTPPRRGEITLDGAQIARKSPHRIARAGISYVPSGRRLFGSLTVRQNLELALRDARVHERDRAWTIERLYHVFARLGDLDSRRAGFLSGGEQQMLKLGRALLAHPKLLLLDEPTEGLAPVVVRDLRKWIELIKRRARSAFCLPSRMPCSHCTWPTADTSSRRAASSRRGPQPSCPAARRPGGTSASRRRACPLAASIRRIGEAPSPTGL